MIEDLFLTYQVVSWVMSLDLGMGDREDVGGE